MVVAVYTVESHLVGHPNEYHILKRNGICRHTGKLPYIRQQEKRLRNQDKYIVENPWDNYRSQGLKIGS